jgi:peptidoglycan/xylan/chitin deacetylase (PgdA/CDA1 family)
LRYSKRYLAKKIFYGFQGAISALIWPFFRFQDRYFPPNQARILMYHNVVHFPLEKEIPYDNVPPELFHAHMRILKHGAFHVISLRELVSLMSLNQAIPPRTIAITFDDGYKNNYTNALPVLLEAGLRATFFIIAGSVGKHKSFDHILWDRMSKQHFRKHPDSRLPISWSEIKELLHCGMEIGSHGLTHRSIGNLDKDEAQREIIRSKEILEEAIASSVTSFAYPFGSKSYNDLNRTTASLLMEAGYKDGCTTEIGAVNRGDSVYELKRIPVRETDHAISFKRKLIGCFDWVQIGKAVFQKNMRRVDKVLW